MQIACNVTRKKNEKKIDIFRTSLRIQLLFLHDLSRVEIFCIENNADLKNLFHLAISGFCRAEDCENFFFFDFISFLLCMQNSPAHRRSESKNLLKKIQHLKKLVCQLYTADKKL